MHHHQNYCILYLLFSNFNFFWFLLRKTIDIVIPELREMRLAHLVSIGSESLCALTPDCEDGYVSLYFWRLHCLHVRLLLLQPFLLHLQPHKGVKIGLFLERLWLQLKRLVNSLSNFLLFFRIISIYFI